MAWLLNVNFAYPLDQNQRNMKKVHHDVDCVHHPLSVYHMSVYMLSVWRLLPLAVSVYKCVFCNNWFVCWCWCGLILEDRHQCQYWRWTLRHFSHLWSSKLPTPTVMCHIILMSWSYSWHNLSCKQRSWF